MRECFLLFNFPQEYCCSSENSRSKHDYTPQQIAHGVQDESDILVMSWSF